MVVLFQDRYDRAEAYLSFSLRALCHSHNSRNDNNSTLCWYLLRMVTEPFEAATMAMALELPAVAAATAPWCRSVSVDCCWPLSVVCLLCFVLTNLLSHFELFLSQQVGRRPTMAAWFWRRRQLMVATDSRLTWRYGIGWWNTAGKYRVLFSFCFASLVSHNLFFPILRDKLFPIVFLDFGDAFKDGVDPLLRRQAIQVGKHGVVPVLRLVFEVDWHVH